MKALADSWLTLLRKQRILPAIAVCVLAYLTTQLLHYDDTGALPESRIDVTELYFQSSHDANSLPTRDYGNRVSLPRVWPEAGHATDKHIGTGWYTALINLNVPPNRLWVVYFPNITANSTIYLNSEMLGRGLRLNDKLAQIRQRPLYLNIPNGMLRADENILQIFVESGDEFFGSLEPFYLGPEESYRDAYTRHYFLKITLPKLICGLLLFAALATGTIWMMRKNESLYGWFAILCVLWSSNILSEFLVDLTELQAELKLHFRFVSIALFCTMLIIVINRYRNVRPLKTELGILVVAIVVSALVVLAPESMRQLISNYLVGAFALTMISYSFLALLKNYADTGTFTDCVIAYSVAVVFFFAFSDLLAAIDPEGEKYTSMKAHYGAPFFVLVLSWKLIKDFVDARNRAEELNQNLELRVAEKTQELEASFKRMQTLEKHQILAEQRDRLIMDMHDGLGGQLVSAMSMLDYESIDRKTVSAAIKEALADLRLMIDSLDPDNDDLAIVLGGFRQRLETTLHGTGVKLRWQVEDVPALDNLGPHNTLQLLRILQEAVTNAMKYSGASEITVRTGTENQRAFLVVADNGGGMPQPTKAGRGLDNMKRRAEALNAQLTIDNSAHGVQLKLVM